MFTKSEDKGKTFSKAIILSNYSKNSDNPEISVFNDNVYIVWQERVQNKLNENKHWTVATRKDKEAVEDFYLNQNEDKVDESKK